MHALVFDQELQIQHLPEPELEADEALIRPLLVGICATDLQLMRGYKRFRGVLGHEFVGTVVALCRRPLDRAACCWRN
jgi:alcohol dehydrogenase